MSMIFLSHSGEDNAWGQCICDWLQGSANKQQPDFRYPSLFLDFDPEQGIPVGRSWRETLYEKLQLCRAMIVICSAAYGQSKWCLAELGVAMASGKLVLPVRIEESPPLRLLNETQRTPLVAIDPDPTGLEGWQRLERGLAALSWQECLAWPPDNEPDASPFPGLSCFERKHAPVFFGQDQTLRQAQAKVEALTARPRRCSITQQVASALAARACLLPSSASRAASSSARALARESSSSVSSCSASWPMAEVSSWASIPSCQREPDRCSEQTGPVGSAGAASREEE